MINKSKFKYIIYTVRYNDYIMIRTGEEFNNITDNTKFDSEIASRIHSGLVGDISIQFETNDIKELSSTVNNLIIKLNKIPDISSSFKSLLRIKISIK